MAKKAKAKRKDASASPRAKKDKTKAAEVFSLVVEGDSWEHLPDFGLKALPIVGGSNYDLSRALVARGHTIHNIAYWGDTIAAIASARDYLNALKHTKAKLLLLGGGGNDLLGDGKLKTYLRLYSPERQPKDYVLDSFYQELRSVILHYESILQSIAANSALKNVKVVVHGYDYARPMKLGWLGEPLAFVGIDEYKAELQQDIVKVLMDAFNEELKAFAGRHDAVIYVDFRGVVGDRWHDELHPSKAAFGDLAGIIERKLIEEA
jgi:hypothetical protein